MNALIIIFFAACAGTMVGIYFFKKYRAREKYFFELYSFIEKLIIDIKYRQDSLIKIIQEEKINYKSEFCSHLEVFINKCNNINSDYKKGCLTKNELALIKKFFYSLGRSDADTELMQLEWSKSEFDNYYKKAAEQNKRYGSASIKLGFILGIGVGILFL